VTVDMNRIAKSSIVCSDARENPLDPNSAVKTVCSNFPAAKNELGLDYRNDGLIKSWGILIGMTMLFGAVAWLFLERQEPLYGLSHN